MRSPGSVAEDALVALCRLATVVPVLSRSEGFGFPVLEALRVRDAGDRAARTAQAELAGEAGIAVDPPTRSRASRGRCATARSERARLGAAERRRARADFTWDRSAEQVEALWQELAP